MKLSSFNFELPKELVPKYPIEHRDDSRLMVVHRESGTIRHHSFKEILRFFEPEDVLVLNNSKVAPCYLQGCKERTNAEIGVLLLLEVDDQNHLWDVWIDFARKIRVGNKICFTPLLLAEVIDNTTSRGRIIKFCFDGDSEMLKQIFEQVGVPPVLQALNRPAELIDKQRYQNIYAEVGGSVVPPFAGFHFSPFLLKSFELKDVLMPTITLHIGIHTLKRVEAEDFSKYKIHSDPYTIPKETAHIVNNALKNHKKVCAVGTSTLKAIETSISYTRDLQPGEGWTSKLIYPPYQPQIANALLTNFHRPRSIDFINTLAFAGPELTMQIYETAIQNGYKFFVYGDALLIL